MTSVFVIDDDADVRELMTLLLQDEGYEVHPFRDAGEALRTLRGTVRPNAILLDMMMPGMSGWEFLSQERQDSELSAIPVAIVSGDPLACQSASELGTTFLKKPFEAEDLLALVRRLTAPGFSV
jgi:CheY-like chemotaxis protein